MSKLQFNHKPYESSSRTVYFQVGAWALSLLTVIISFLAWGKTYGWHFTPFNAYQIFPLLGLLAFGLMWSHYITGTIGDIAGLDGSTLKKYFRYTGYATLALICLHPGVLIAQRFRDGFGLPPHSYESYVAPGLGWVTLLGTASFLVFIAYEFGRIFSGRSWWHFVTEAGDFAMLAILYHGIRLGGDLQHGWFRVVWLFYTVSLVAVLLRSYYNKYGRVQPAA